MPYFLEQQAYFKTSETRSVAFRIRQLTALREAILLHEEEICKALYADLGKSGEESYLTEIGVVLMEIRHAIANCKRWSRPRRVGTELFLFPSRALLCPEPLGVCLVIAPWNYPFQLALDPLVSALAAGNCVTLKPSELAPATAHLLAKIIGETFEPGYCAVVEGGADVARAQTLHPYDRIFFTGSARVGRLVLEQAAQNLTPVTLELGGKSPCIVDETANLPVAAQRIAWGKVINAGQTCVAPDYLLVHRSVKGDLVRMLQKNFLRFYGTCPEKNPLYPRIVTPEHYRRLTGLLEEVTLYEGGKILWGGGCDGETNKIAPTLLEGADPASPLMQEEIFGPLLPILVYDDFLEVLDYLTARPKPLALYLFSEDTAHQRAVLEGVSFGGGCINSTLFHLSSKRLPFGGVGESGMGQCHGKAGFDTFTHQKSVLKQGNFPNVTYHYPPMAGKLGGIKRIFR